MNILGVHCYGHDTAAALVIDNKFIQAIEEERLTRKHDNSHPIHAIEWCLKYAGLDINDIDIIGTINSRSSLRKVYDTLDNFPLSLPLLVKEIIIS